MITVTVTTMSAGRSFAFQPEPGDESFQAIDCICTDNQKQGNKTPHTSYTLTANRDGPNVRL